SLPTPPMPTLSMPPPSSKPPALKSSGLMRPVISIGEFSRTKTPIQDSLAPQPLSAGPTVTISQPPLETVEQPTGGWDFGFPKQEKATEPGVGAQSRKLELVAEPSGERLSDPPAAVSPALGPTSSPEG